jgi:endoglycosylceramidase
LRRAIGIVAAVAAAAVMVAPAAAAPSAPLNQSGRWITDAKGRVVILHGVNMVYKRRPYHPLAAGFDRPDARFLARNGLNAVRLGIIYAGVEPQPGRYDDAYLRQIRRSLRTLARAGVFSQLDFHQDLYNERFQGEGFPDWAVQDDGLPAQPQAGFPANYIVMPALNRAFDHFWNNDPGPGGVGLQDRYAAAWGHVARRFRNEPYNMGYDLFNEPWPGTGWQACANTAGCPLFDQQKLTPMSQRAYNAIRRHDKRNVVWYEPNVLFNNGPQTHHGDIGRHSGMSFHIYCLQEGQTPRPSPMDEEQARTCEPFETLPFQNANAQSRRTGDALILSEFGATDDLGQIERLEDYADRYMVGWLYWHYCECDDPTTAGVGGTQSVVSDARKPPTGSNVKSGKLDVLTRPYPQAVAGVPTRWRFDPDSKRFELAYTTARKGGGRFAFRADTQVFASPRHYPGGYDVRVRGGEAISAPGKRLLRVRTCTGRRRVEVTLTPGGGNFRADCRAPRTDPTKIRVRVRPRHVGAGRRTRFRFRVTVRRGRPLRGALIRFAGRRSRTNRRGRASLRVRLGRRGRRRVVVSKRGYRRGRATVRVLRPR